MNDSDWGADKLIWSTGTAPYTPVREDIELIRRACPPEIWASANAPRILVLGITPALVGGPWPERSEVHAVDYDDTMIDLHWREGKGRRLHRARWEELPFPDGHFDLVVGDGSLNSVPGLDGYEPVLRELDRVRRPGAPLIARLFVQPEPRLALGELAGLASTAFAGWSSTAKRLAILLAATPEDGGLYFPEISARITEQCGDIEAFLAAMGQSPAEIERAKHTYTMEQRVNYPTRSQVVAKLQPHFSSIEFQVPDYDAGAICPIMRCI